MESIPTRDGLRLCFLVKFKILHTPSKAQDQKMRNELNAAPQKNIKTESNYLVLPALMFRFL